MAKCSICGAEMTARKDDKRHVYAVQMCSIECMARAWTRVTRALKRGVRPEWGRASDLEVCKERQRRHVTEAERVEVLELYEQELTVAEIAEKMNRSYKTIKNIVDNYELVEVEE